MHIVYKWLFYGLLFVGTTALGQSKHDHPMIPAIKQGRTAFFDGRLKTAEQQFRHVLQTDKNPMNVALAQYALSTMAVWQFGFGQNTLALNAFKRENEAFNTSIRYVTHPVWRRFLAAESAMHRAIIGVFRNDMLAAAMAGREAYNGYSWCLEQDPFFEEAYKGMGLMQVLIGSAPRSYHGLLSFLGYKGTVQDGLNNLMRAIKKAKWVQEEAAIYFALADETLNRNQRNGLVEIKKLQEAYPQSPLFNFLYGYALRNQFRAAEALPFITSATQNDEKKGAFSPPIFLFYLADLHFRLNNFEEAIPLFKRFIAEFEGTTMVGQAHFKMGLAMEMKGDREAAIAMYQKVKAGFEYDMDEFAVRQATLRIANPMTPIEKDLLRIQNASDAGDYPLVLTEVDKILEQKDATELNLAEAGYRKGLALQKTQQYEAAITFYQQVIHKPGDVLAKWAPYSQYYIGECYEALNRPEDAVLAYRKALMYREKFDYHKGLEQRTKSALSRLKSGN